MVKRIVLFLMLIFCAVGAAQAAHGHYVSGVEGIKAATLPPPGAYYRMYNVWYTADSYRNNRGGSEGDFEADVFANVHRFIYSSDIELLGANLVVDIAVPLQYTHLTIGEMGDNEFGLGDILVEPFILAWHKERWDVALGFGAYLPTGKFGWDKPASAGKGFWTFMFTFGGTYYFDEAKTWSASVLARYEIHTKQRDTDITPGHDFHFEWGLGKSIMHGPGVGIFDFGLAGYCSWTITQDSGDLSGNDKEAAYAIGPEIGYTYIPWGASAALRVLWEFENRNATQGTIATLAITKAF